MPKRNSGFVLVCVLWVLAILTVLVLGFGRRAYLDARAAGLSLDQAESMAMARGAVKRGMAEIEMRQFVRGILEVWLQNNPAAQLDDVDWFSQLNYMGVYDGREDYAAQFEGIFEDEQCLYIIEDEERRFNINTMPLEILEELDGINFRTISAIEERITEEAQSERPPFMVLEELLTLRGITERAWLGDGTTPGLRDILTVHGDGRININTASPEVLGALPDIDSRVIAGIIEFRAGRDGQLNTEDDRQFRSMQHAEEVLDASPAEMARLNQYCKTESEFFTITGLATRRQGRVQAQSKAICHLLEDELVVIEWRETVSGS